MFRSVLTRLHRAHEAPHVKGQAQRGGQPNKLVGASSPPPSTPSKPLTMVGTNNAVAAPRHPTQGETAIQEFANSSSSLEQLKQRAAPLLTSRELLQDVQRLTPEVRTKFVDKVDQVCRYGRSFSLGIFPSLIL